MTDAQDRVPNTGQDVDDATEPDREYDQLGSAGNPFERTAESDSATAEAQSAESGDESFTADSDADFGMGIPASNDPQRLPDGPGPT